jgi:hypothetical protein
MDGLPLLPITPQKCPFLSISRVLSGSYFHQYGKGGIC